MKNTGHFNASLYLRMETAMDKEEFQNLFNTEIVVHTKVEFTLANGETFTASIADLAELNLIDFENNMDKEKEVTEDQSVTNNNKYCLQVDYFNPIIS